MARRKAEFTRVSEVIEQQPVGMTAEQKLDKQLLDWRAVASPQQEVLMERDGVRVRLRFDSPMTENVMVGVFVDGTGWLWGKSPVILGLGDKAWLQHMFSEIDTQIASRTK
jgi:hypothetical protein